MPGHVPDQGIPDVSDAARRTWWSFRHYNPRSAEDPYLAWQAAYRRAYRDCLADTAEFAGLKTSVDRLADLLEDGRVERDAVLSAAEEFAAR
jgi:hypothetical protein